MAHTDLQETLRERVGLAITAAFGDDGADTDPLLRPSDNPAFGDFQANVAMSLAKRLGRKPREVAAQIVAKLDVSDISDDPEIAGPGFINFRVRNDALARVAEDIASDRRLGVPKEAERLTIVVDYSGPNVAKEMHVGHIRSTLIGDALARTLEFLGHEVIRQNHLGDWGTQFGMLIEHLLEDPATAGGEAEIADLDAFYKAANARFKSDDTFATRARERVVKLQSGDAETLRLWHALIAESKRHFSEVYARLGVSLTDDDIRAESAYNDQLADVIEELRQAGLVEESEGALCVFNEGFTRKDGAPLPMIIEKRDGGHLYTTTDLAALRFRTRELGADRVAYVVDSRQADHFAMVFATAKRAGWLGERHRAEFVPFGTILGEDRKPFKTRSDETVKLAALLDEAIERAAVIVNEKNPELTPTERDAIAAVVGIGAVKYADLCGDRIKDYVFSWERMLKLEGNTAPYLQYAYARVRSIFRRGEVNPAELRGAPISIAEDAERALVLALARFGATTRTVAATLEPHHLCTYLFELSTAFSRFFETCPVLKAEEPTRTSRLELCDLTARTLERGLGLLGIDVLDRI